MSNEAIIRESTWNLLSPNSPCTVTFAGNTIQVSAYLHSPVDPKRKTVSAPRRTRNTERRTDDKPFVRSLTSFHSLVPFINANFLATPSEIHLVLTYYPQTFDAYQPARDFKPFWKKVLYRYPDYRYISVLEPHANGAWHLHVLLRSFSESPQLIDLKRLQQLWPHGGTNARFLTDSPAFGSYFLPTQRNEKLQRLHYYPLGIRLYNSSLSMHRPIKEFMTLEEASYLTQGLKLISPSQIDILSSDGYLLNQIRREVFQISADSQIAPELLGFECEEVKRMVVYQEIPFEVECDENISRLFARTVTDLLLLQEQLIARNILAEPLFQATENSSISFLKEVR